MALPFPNMSFVAFDVLTAAEMNQMSANDNALADGTGLNDNAITTAKLAPGSVTPGKLSLGSGFSLASGGNTTTSTSFVGIAGSEVTVNVPTTGRVLVTLTIRNLRTTSSSTQVALAGIRSSGANTIGDQDWCRGQGNNQKSAACTHLFTGLNSGSTTFTVIRRSSGGDDITCENPRLTVIPIG